MKPLLSIIIPVYNSEDYIEDCLNSISNQSFRDFEVILIDDGSIDNSYRICACFSEKDIRFRIISQAHKGVSATRNKGIREAQGRYIAFVDSDDYLALNAYELMINKAEETSASQVVCSSFTINRGNTVENHHYFGNAEIVGSCVQEDLAKPLAFTGGTDKRCSLLVPIWNKIYRRSIIVDNQILFEEQMSAAEDFLFNINFYRFATNVSFIETPLYNHRIVSGSLSNTYRKERFLQESIAFRRYHEWFPEEFDFVQYMTSIVSLNRVCIRLSSREKGFPGLFEYIQSVRSNEILDVAYRNLYKNGFIREFYKTCEIRFALLPLVKHYIKKLGF